jgi:hypothetical protein
MSALWMNCDFRTLHWVNRVQILRMQDEFAKNNPTSDKPCTNVFEKGYRCIRAALELGLQLCMQRNDEGFRKVYLEVSETCVEEAVKRGKEDEEAVQDYLQDTRAQEASVMISDHGPRYSGRQRQRLQ